MPNPSFIIPETAADMAAFHALCWDYRDFLLTLPRPDRDVVVEFYSEQTYQSILSRFETDNRPPQGQMRLALLDGQPVGCGTIQKFSAEDAEIKRVYVSPDARGSGIGRLLMDQLVLDCRTLGFRRILMDTGRKMVAAQELYDRMGFERRGPYQPVPPVADGILVFFQMRLD